MVAPETAKDAHRGNGDVFLNSEQFCRPLEYDDTRSIQDIQAFRLNRQFGFAFETAAVIASLAWGIAR
jgi:hypothetical protein